MTGAGESYDLTAGQQYIFNGTDQLTFDAQAAPEFDNFEDWCQAQDQRENNSVSARYVSRDVDGYYDLDGNGDWQTDPDYGAIWVPAGVAVGWAPYRYGHWVWIGPWGWTWVGDEPWGFAPYHYGRWAQVRGGYWGWVPGPMVVRPVYAPALVGFVGGAGFGVGVGFGSGFSGVAWFPLGPRDVYIPSYRTSPRYVQNINITNTRVVNVTQVTTAYNNYVVNQNVGASRVDYTYAHNAVAVTAVSRETFVGAKPVGTGFVRVTPEQLQNAHVIEQTPLAPTRSSYVAAAARPARGTPPVAFSERPVVARLNPPMPVTSHNAVHSLNASAAPGAGQTASLPRGTTSRPHVHPRARTPTMMWRVRRSIPTPMRARTSTTTRMPTPTAIGANERQNANGNERRPTSPNERPAANDAAQQHPAVKFTPPTKAKDDDYDVHPPLNHHANTPAPAEHHEQAPASHPAPAQHESAPPAPRPKS